MKKDSDWIIGGASGVLAGYTARSISKDPSITKMKWYRKKKELYETGLSGHQYLQESKKELQQAAAANTKQKGDIKMTQTNGNATQTKKRGKLPLAMLTGAVIGGAFVLIKNPEERKRIMEGTKSTKNAVTGYASEVKEDPKAKKDDLLTRIQNVVTIANEAITTVQEVFNNQGKEITEKVKDIKEESEAIIHTAKDAGEDLQEVGGKAKEAKEELTESKEEPSVQQEKVVEVNAQR
ncbi:hypothetical protein QRD89_18320 [Halobacillus sp. ACCC02827]|uniref:hypothetical protein n=1 Tax=Bacillaceae TaxID=186817 RepID=UPI0002A50D7D|nr:MULTISPECIES: hypothetical protein [Bacillaceae]ELK48244.1 hypothetical protein D479_03578 [Halobacillus sp. BAB-2008]QHT48418.1 hypothetical protein M662_18635 [Bacillus sp. SB49]WJE15651.1 hypothetical protein QRD89_18320 [Halobacillus sp. ACCC02827]